MLAQRISIIVIALALAVSGCTSSGDVYDSEKHKKDDFSWRNTILLGVGVAAVIGAAAAAADSNTGYTNSYSGSNEDDDWDWDYQPANGQWVCRGVQTGRYAELENCYGDIQDDDRWPG